MTAPLAALLDEAVEARAAPALAAAVLRDGRLVHLSAHGRLAEGPAGSATWFDLASLTKPLATGLSALALAGRGALPLDAPASRFLPAFRGGGKEAITIELLLAHASGLPAWRPYFARAAADPVAGAAFRGEPSAEAFARGRALVDEAVDAEPLETRPGQATRYSDTGYLALGRIVEAAAAEPLDAFWRREIASRLGETEADFFALPGGPPPPGRPIAATGTARPRPPAPGQEAALAGVARFEIGPRPGEVDDDNAFARGGVAGHAGLFGTAPAVARLGQAFLEETEGAARLAPAALARRFASPRPGAARGLSWDRPDPAGSSMGSLLGAGPRGAVGHLGFTGCSLWIDLDARLVVALLSNRTLAGRASEGVRRLRSRFHDAVARAFGGVD